MSEGMAAHPSVPAPGGEPRSRNAVHHAGGQDQRLNTHARAAARLEQMGGSWGRTRNNRHRGIEGGAAGEQGSIHRAHQAYDCISWTSSSAATCQASMWQSCVMEAGADACAAGGPCKHAREVLDWTEDLQCVDPNRVGPGMPWARRFFQWLIEMGKVEVMPASLRGKQRWGMCMHASVMRHCSSSPILLQMVTLCFFACSKPKPAPRQQVRGRAPAVAPGQGGAAGACGGARLGVGEVSSRYVLAHELSDARPLPSCTDVCTPSWL